MSLHVCGRRQMRRTRLPPEQECYIQTIVIESGSVHRRANRSKIKVPFYLILAKLTFSKLY